LPLVSEKSPQLQMAATPNSLPGSRNSCRIETSQAAQPATVFNNRVSPKSPPRSHWGSMVLSQSSATGRLLQPHHLQNLRHTFSLHPWLRPGTTVITLFLKSIAMRGYVHG
jgi:hypothetical protein